MTQAQKIAKAKFKQAIAYRQKTGVSLKEAFAKIYGKKKVVKKAVKKSAPKKVAKKVIRKKAVKKVAKKRVSGVKDSALVKKELAKKGLKMPHGYATIKRKRKVGSVTLKKSNYHPRDERYIIMNDGKQHLEGKPFFKEQAKEIASALRKVKAKRKKVGAVKKKPTEKAILNKIHIVKRNVDKLDEAQHKHMMGSIKYMSNKYLNTVNEINNYESIIKNIQSNINLMSAMEKKRAKETINNFKKIVKELKTHSKELKKLI
jgi:hypothetical protein